MSSVPLSVLLPYRKLRVSAFFSAVDLTKIDRDMRLYLRLNLSEALSVLSILIKSLSNKFSESVMPLICDCMFYTLLYWLVPWKATSRFNAFDCSKT